MEHTTRRALLGAAALAPIALALPTAAAPATRTAWATALDRYERAEAAVRVDEPLHDAAHEAWKAAQPSEEIVLWREFPFANRPRILWMDVDKAEADWLAAEGKLWWGSPARMLAAFESVRNFQRQWHANPYRPALDVASERNDALDNERFEAEEALWAMPAPDLEALAWKLERYLADDADYAITSRRGAVLADVRRLLVA